MGRGSFHGGMVGAQRECDEARIVPRWSGAESSASHSEAGALHGGAVQGAARGVTCDAGPEYQFIGEH
jgi:hypothetical protein